MKIKFNRMIASSVQLAVCDMTTLRRRLLSVRAGSSNLAESVYAIEMYQHENLHTTSYTCKLSKNHWFLLIKSFSMYENDVKCM